MKCWQRLVSSFVVVLWLMPASAEETWLAGTARSVITPQEPLWMAGYASRTRPAEGKEHDLWLKVLALQDSQGNRAVLLSFDLLGISKSIYDTTCELLERKFGLGRAQIMLACSHTHCGPVLRGALLDIYPLDEQQLKRIEAYSTALESKIVESVTDAWAALKPVQLTCGQGMTRFAVNRRNNPAAQVPSLRQQGALEGPMDHSVPVLAVRAADGKLLTVVFGYACHNTTLSYYNWCGDYAGFAQLALEKSHPDLQAMFFIGCGADQNPLPRRSLEDCQRYGIMLAGAVEETLHQPMTVLTPRLDTAFELTTLEMGPAPSREELQKLASGKVSYRQRWAQRLLADLDAGREFARTYPYPLQVWRLGGTQWWISMGGEVVVDFALRFKREIDPSTWIAGYTNDVMAYIPSQRVLQEGGYEGASSMAVYGLPANRWADDVEERVVQAVHRLVTKIKQPTTKTPAQK